MVALFEDLVVRVVVETDSESISTPHNPSNQRAPQDSERLGSQDNWQPSRIMYFRRDQH